MQITVKTGTSVGCDPTEHRNVTNNTAERENRREVAKYNTILYYNRVIQLRYGFKCFHKCVYWSIEKESKRHRNQTMCACKNIMN